MNIGQYIIYNTVHAFSFTFVFVYDICFDYKKNKKSKFDCPSVDYWPCEVPNRSG